MKIIGIILLVLGIMSLIGGFIISSESPLDERIVALIVKIGIILSGLYLINRSKNKKAT
ncbi:MAG: hypothetical protein IPF54_22305 [Draconibacterium sp.]|nr:hypothetical protein [Draconibacterium sp.]